MKKSVLILFIFLAISGCISVPNVNDNFRKVDLIWLAEYQQTEDEFRYRVVNVPFEIAYELVRKSLIDLGMPILKEDFKRGFIFTQAHAPTPLTIDEWKKVAEYENQRLKDTLPWYMWLTEDPSDYVVSIKANIKKFNQLTIISLDYGLSHPKYLRQGIIAAKTAPPSSVKIGSAKFWKHLEKHLAKIGENEPRRRNPAEFDI